MKDLVKIKEKGSNEKMIVKWIKGEYAKTKDFKAYFKENPMILKGGDKSLWTLYTCFAQSLNFTSQVGKLVLKDWKNKSVDELSILNMSEGLESCKMPDPYKELPELIVAAKTIKEIEQGFQGLKGNRTVDSKEKCRKEELCPIHRWISIIKKYRPLAAINGRQFFFYDLYYLLKPFNFKLDLIYNSLERFTKPEKTNLLIKMFDGGLIRGLRMKGTMFLIAQKERTRGLGLDKWDLDEEQLKLLDSRDKKMAKKLGLPATKKEITALILKYSELKIPFRAFDLVLYSLDEEKDGKQLLAEIKNATRK